MTRSLISYFMLAVVSVSSLAPLARADGPQPQRGHRYRTTYRSFDRGFHNYYGYNESVVCDRSYYNGWDSTTCYPVQPDEYVYVQEQIMDNGQSRVVVYRDQDSKSPSNTRFITASSNAATTG